MTLFKEHNGIFLRWPSRRSDKNPIQNVWRISSCHIYDNGCKQYYTAPKKAAQLELHHMDLDIFYQFMLYFRKCYYVISFCDIEMYVTLVFLFYIKYIHYKCFGIDNLCDTDNTFFSLFSVVDVIYYSSDV